MRIYDMSYYLHFCKKKSKFHFILSVYRIKDTETINYYSIMSHELYDDYFQS